MKTCSGSSGARRALGAMTNGWFWLRLGLGFTSRAAPGLAAWLLHGLYSRPALTRYYSRGERALLREAAALLSGAERLDTRVKTGRRAGLLRAYRFRACGDARGLVLLLHGWTADSRAMAGFIAPLVEAGYDALAVDLPAHGGSSGLVTDAESGAAAVQAMLKERRLAPDHVIAHSFGGAVASVLAAAGVTPRAYVSLSAPTAMTAALEELANAFALAPAARIRLLARARRAAGKPLHEYDVQRIWRARASSILALHAPEDESVSFAHAERWRDLPNARLSLAHGVGHREIVFHEGSVAAALAHILDVDRAGDAAA